MDGPCCWAVHSLFKKIKASRRNFDIKAVMICLISYVIILEFVFQKWAFCAIMFSKDFSSACLKYSSHLDV